MSNKTSRIIVLDLECTCWGKPCDRTPEIIEIGACVYNNRTNNITDCISLIVRPKNLDISEYCTALTGLTENDVKRGQWLNEALGTLRKNLPLRSCPWGSWGDYDRTQLMSECEEKAINYPFNRTHLNIKFLFGLLMRDKTGSGLSKALERLNMKFEGEPHRASFDAYNTARILQNLCSTDINK